MSSTLLSSTDVWRLLGPEGVVIFVIICSFVAWMVVDCVLHEPSRGGPKPVWLLVIFFVPCGSMIYYVARKLPDPLRLPLVIRPTPPQALQPTPRGRRGFRESASVLARAASLSLRSVGD